jgi:2-polyprenyl-3-methyl-5-hydroxy-6-metoxy-1,4-benzoquinol methylase
VKTIERINLESQEITPVYLESLKLHIERYQYAAKVLQNKNLVLDIACGTGYGSKILSDAGIKFVIGVDISEEAISEANKISSDGKLIFIKKDYKELNVELINQVLQLNSFNGFDAIVSFETIEHLPEPELFLKIIMSLLNQNGLLLLSLPVTPSMDANPYHLHDFSSRSIEKLLRKNGLEIVDLMKQYQTYNPFTVRKEYNKAGVNDLRRGLLKFYLKNPSKFFLRIYSFFRFGFKNIYHLYTLKKLI